MATTQRSPSSPSPSCWSGSTSLTAPPMATFPESSSASTEPELARGAIWHRSTARSVRPAPRPAAGEALSDQWLVLETTSTVPYLHARVEIFEGIRRDSESPVLEPNTRKPLVVHRFDDHPSPHPEAPRRLSWPQDLRARHRWPPSSRPSLPWRALITVANSSTSPGASPAVSMVDSESSNASRIRKASSRLSTSRGAGIGSEPWLPHGSQEGVANGYVEECDAEAAADEEVHAGVGVHGSLGCHRPTHRGGRIEDDVDV